MSRDDIETLVGLVKEQVTDARDAADALARDAAQAWDAYFRRKDGSERDGYSTVTMSDVADTVEWILPHLMRMFTTTTDIVSISPQSEDDIDIATEMRDYAWWVWTTRNRGFINTYTAFKSALVEKLGILKIWVDEESTRFRIRIEPVPPEEFLISPDAKSVEDAAFVGHRRAVMRGSLVAMGLDRDDIETLEIAHVHNDDTDEAKRARRTIEGSFPDDGSRDWATQLVYVVEAYVQADLNEDGVPEMYRVLCGNETGDVYLDHEPWDDPRPFVFGSPIIVPHRLHGQSVAELVTDLQKVRTSVVRQYLDALYLANNPRQEVEESSIVDPEELMSIKPGGFVRVRRRGAITPMSIPFAGEAALAGLQYIDLMRENRTGVSARVQGIGESPLHETATGERLLLSAAQAKLVLIAQILGETIIAPAFALIIKLAMRYGTEDVIRVNGATKSVYADDWDDDFDISISVSMTTGDHQLKLQYATMLLQMQKDAREIGMVRPDQLIETAAIIVDAMGLKDVNRFFSLPQQENAGSSADADAVAAQAAQQQMMAGVEAQMEAIRAEVSTTLEKIASNERIAGLEAQVKTLIAQMQDATKRLDLKLEDDREREALGLDRRKLDIDAASAKANAILAAGKQLAPTLPPPNGEAVQ